jgi:nucleotide-binding universal stress UspA family protein
VDLIAMATRGRGALGQLIFGSVANRVARVSPVPLMLIHPTDDTPSRPNHQRIVVPYDGSELATEAFPLAASLSKQLNLPVHLIETVYEPASAAPDFVIGNVIGAAKDAASEDLERATAQLRELGVEATSEVLVGSPFSAISLATRPGDILSVTSHGRTGVHRWLLGSVAEKLVQQATAPVILVPAKARQHLVANHQPA